MQGTSDRVGQLSIIVALAHVAPGYACLKVKKKQMAGRNKRFVKMSAAKNKIKIYSECRAFNKFVLYVRKISLSSKNIILAGTSIQNMLIMP